VSHSIAEVARLATTIVLIADGNVAAVGPAVDLLTRLDLSALTGRIDTGAVIDSVPAACAQPCRARIPTPAKRDQHNRAYSAETRASMQTVLIL
jgi:ABC-type multidrug transport system ATPase subunit